MTHFANCYERNKSMKLNIKLLASMLVLVPVAANAQRASGLPGLQVYGRIDLSMNHVRFDSKPGTPSSQGTYVTSDTSFIGFRGTEDLGDGLRAYFKLEHGFNADTGAPSSPTIYWSRESLVGIGSSTWGSVQLGYQYSPAQWLTTKVDPFGRSGTGSIVQFFQQSGATGPRGFTATTANTIGYLSPPELPLFARVVIGTDEGVAPYSKPFMFSVEHTGDRHFIGLSHDRVKVAGSAAGQPAKVNVTDTTTAVGATYRFDNFKLHGYYIRNKLDGTNGMNGGLLGISVPFGQSELTLSALRRNRNDVADSDATQIAVRLTHYFSKRSLVYAGVARHINHGTSAFAPNPARQDFAAGTPAAGQSSAGLQFGMRHLF